jgi:beta-lactamase class A
MYFRLAIPITLSAFLFGAAAAQPLQDRLQSQIGGFAGKVSLYAKNLDTGATIGIRESEPVRTASTIKLPIMLAVFDAVARGQAKWTETLAVADSERTTGTGVIGSEISTGVEVPLRDAVHLMIVLSDNTATNMILERFTTDAVNTYLDKIGIGATRSLRKISKSGAGKSAAGKLPGNEKYGIGVTTPRDMVSILEKLEGGEIVSPEASREMIAILKRCRDDYCIRRRRGANVVANKTGALDDLRSDVGIVYSKGGRIAMAITVQEMPKVDYSPDNAGCVLIAELATTLVEGLARK